MLQFDANAHTNVDASVNGPLLFTIFVKRPQDEDISSFSFADFRQISLLPFDKRDKMTLRNLWSSEMCLLTYHDIFRK